MPRRCQPQVWVLAHISLGRTFDGARGISTCRHTDHALQHTASKVKTGPRIVIADDHLVVAQGLRALLVHHCNVIAVVHDPRELIGALIRHAPDVLLLDLSMPYLNGLEILTRVRQKFDKMRVLVITMHTDRNFAEVAFERGADGFIPKSTPAEELRKAITTIVSGERYLSPAVPRRGYREPVAAAEEAPECLTPRQHEILCLIGEARNSTDIAKQLGISARTLAFHRAQIRRSLGITTELGLIQYAVTSRLAGSARADESTRDTLPPRFPPARG